MKIIRKEYESQFKKTERGLIHYSEWLENKLEYSQLQTREEEIKYDCPDCGGDGNETCHNPDHGFLEGVMSLKGANESACPCCGHNEDYKITKYNKETEKREYCTCYTCNGSGSVTESIGNKYIDENGYDFDLTLQSPPNNQVQVSELIEKRLTNFLIKKSKQLDINLMKNAHELSKEFIQDLKQIKL